MKLHIPDPHRLPKRGSVRRPARNTVPTKIGPKYRRPLEVGVKGAREDDPVVIGTADGSPAMLVRADGMRVEAVRKGQERWVTGDGVLPALEAGWFVLVATDDDDSD